MPSTLPVERDVEDAAQARLNPEVTYRQTPEHV